MPEMSSMTLEKLQAAASFLIKTRPKPVIIDRESCFWFLVSEETGDMILKDLNLIRSANCTVRIDSSVT